MVPAIVATYGAAIGSGDPLLFVVTLSRFALANVVAYSATSTCNS